MPEGSKKAPLKGELSAKQTEGFLLLPMEEPTLPKAVTAWAIGLPLRGRWPEGPDEVSRRRSLSNATRGQRATRTLPRRRNRPARMRPPSFFSLRGKERWFSPGSRKKRSLDAGNLFACLDPVRAAVRPGTCPVYRLHPVTVPSAEGSLHSRRWIRCDLTALLQGRGLPLPAERLAPLHNLR